MIEKSRSLEVSENLINLLLEKHSNNLGGYIDTFNNCRETGFVLKLTSINNMNFKDQFVVWMHEDRISDDIVIRYANTFKDCNTNNMFSDRVNEGQSMFFPPNNYEVAVQYIIDTAEKIIKLEQEKTQESEEDFEFEDDC